VDVLHVQYTAPPFAPCPVVATIHDLSFEHLPETFKRRSRMQLRLTVRRTARRAAHVIAPSEFTRRDLIETYGLDPARVTAIPLAAAPHFRPVDDRREVERVRRRYRLGGEYVLAVGSIQPRKNLPRLVRAYSLLRRERGRSNLPQLVLAGKQAWLYGETLRAIEEEGVGGSVILTGYVSEADLPALYTGALCFVYPSYFEGFGIPILEAMASGTPVLASSHPSLDEACGDAAVRASPDSPEELAAGIELALKERASLAARGLEHARRFTWQASGKAYLHGFSTAL
jgi:glycosyltransferase involved in cell wall biosynthesis